MPGPTEPTELEKSLSDVWRRRQVDPTQIKLVAVINWDGDQAGHNYLIRLRNHPQTWGCVRNHRPVI